MAKLIIENKYTTFTIQHRAACNTDENHWTGIWRDNLPKANQDAEKHRNDNKYHDVWIETKQTSVVKTLFTGI
ncbi:hypothetical protein LCGC14_0710500 [marine sediment metagenome]|uniref:Uncharacterized protein n=2 Tax=root TaxID=1 RepID=A0A831QLY8_9FLAO|nr:hypothetical protein [Pricia antarctica]